MVKRLKRRPTHAVNDNDKPLEFKKKMKLNVFSLNILKNSKILNTFSYLPF